MNEQTPDPINDYLDAFLQRLREEQHVESTVKSYRQCLDVLAKGMQEKSIPLENLTMEIAHSLVQRKAANTRYHINRFVRFLGDQGACTPLRAPTENEVIRAALRTEFETYLREQRGVSDGTIQHASYMARRFLEHTFGDGPDRPDRITPTDITSFLRKLLDRKSPYRDKTISTHLRSFMRFLFQTGKTKVNLGNAIPSVAHRHGTRLPRHLTSEQVEAVLETVRKVESAPKRNYAMVLLMARYGLRPPEVIAIQLDDIDWRAAEILIRGKGQRHDRIPLLPDVGAAVADYIQHERVAKSRHLFVSSRGPHRPFKDSQILNVLLRNAYEELGLKPSIPYVGSHILRHSLATNLFGKGASLDEISNTLRHRSRATTLKYARLDVDGLRSISLPWPTEGGAA
jgi:site-specific recombinase XerD